MSQKIIDTREWYDFIGQLGDILPGLHLGGQDATQQVLEMCQIDAASRVPQVPFRRRPCRMPERRPGSESR